MSLRPVVLCLVAAATVWPAAVGHGAAGPTEAAAANPDGARQPHPEGAPPRRSEPAGAVPARPSPHRGAHVARVMVPTRALSGPGWGRVVARLRPHVMGHSHPTELLVLDARRDNGGVLWLNVRLDRRPNRAAAWIRADMVRLRHTPLWVRVELASRTLTVLRRGRVVLRARGVVGAPRTPTPRGLFAVQLVASQINPRGFLGPVALHLTAHSQVLANYGGGPGRVAIHGRGAESLADPLGSARSNGCIRLNNAVVRRLARLLRPGTPVSVVLRAPRG